MERQVAIVAYQGVLADETHAFRSVLARAPDAHVVTVGAARGVVAGPGGVQVVDATFDDVRHASIVVVPGGLGSHRHPEIAAWTVAVRPEFVLTSSTGSALLAAAGVLRGRTAATHWLAGPLLERHGVTVSHERVAVDGPFVTATGQGSALDAAFLVVGRIWGPAAVARIREELATAPAEEPPCEARTRYRARPAPARRRHQAITGVVEVELEDVRGRAAGGDTGHDPRHGEPWHHRAMGAAPAATTDPAERWSSTVVLGDGESALVRPIRTTDAPALAAFHDRQSRDSIYRRYFSPKPHLSAADLRHFTEVDLIDRVALVVERQGEFIAWASYERWPGRDDADAAFQVDDAHQGKGIATLLLEHLATIARANGIARFTAEVLADNRPMLAVFSRAGWPVERRFESGVVDLDFALEETEEFRDSVERREQRADSRAVARLLLPRTIAVVGASDEKGSIGRALWRHVTAAAKGEVFPVNPGHGTVDGQTAFARLQDVPADVNLAVVAVPAAALPAVIDDCIAARVRGAVIVTSIEGTDIDIDALVTRARSFGVRLIGPGSMGVAAPRQSVGVDALLVPADLQPGAVAISLQSGSLGASVLRLATDLHMGLSWFVSLGDKSDVSGNDLLQFWEDDETTRVIAMYTESFGNARKFARIARRVSLQRPIVAVRTGAAAIGPTGGALYQQAGLIEVPTVAAMLDTARVLATQPVMRGPRVALLSNARSPHILSEAALHTAGLVVVPTEPPLDWRSTPEDYAASLRAALDDDTVHAVMVVHAPPLAELVDAPVAAIEDAAVGATKPIVTVLMGGRDGPLRKDSTLPAFAFPEPAAGVLGRVHLYGAWLTEEAAATVTDVGDIDRAGAHARIRAAVERGDDHLAVDAVVAVLRAYGVVAPETRCGPAGDAVALAEAIGYPVAVKAERRHLGRSMRAGVALDLAHGSDVIEAVEVMREALGEDAASVRVQPMVAPGLDLRIRSTVDETLGPLVAIGLGGSTTDLVSDEASRLAPLSSASAAALLAGSRAASALEQAGLSVAPVVDTLMRVAQLISDHDEIESVDLNPIIASAEGVAVTDAVVRVGAARPPDGPIRRLD